MPHTSYRRVSLAREHKNLTQRYTDFEKKEPIVLQSSFELTKFTLVSETAENKTKEMNNIEFGKGLLYCRFTTVIYFSWLIMPFTRTFHTCLARNSPVT